MTQTPVLTKLPTVAEVALRRIQIAMSKDTDEEFLREQLKLIEKHSNIGKSFDRYLFCGLVYYNQLKDYSKAAEMFHEAESALGSKYRKDFKNFIKALDINKEYDIKEKYGSKGKYIEAVIGKGDNGSDKKDEIDKDLYLPSGDLLFFAQMAKYHSKIKANEDANLVDEINKTVSSFPPLWQHFFLLLA